MKVLVIDDKKVHQQSARECLTGHDVTVLTSYDAAMKVMETTYDEVLRTRLLGEGGFPGRPTIEDRTQWDAYWELHRQLTERVTVPFPHEVVLTDMMMPMSGVTLAPGIHKHGEQVPYGFVIALRAALRGARYIAMVTDTNHHMGAMSAALDHLGTAYYTKGFRPNFVINGAKCMFVHAPFLKSEAGGSGEAAKDWGQVLKDLLA